MVVWATGPVTDVAIVRHDGLQASGFPTVTVHNCRVCCFLALGATDLCGPNSEAPNFWRPPKSCVFARATIKVFKTYLAEFIVIDKFISKGRA